MIMSNIFRETINIKDAYQLDDAQKVSFSQYKLAKYCEFHYKHYDEHRSRL